VGVADFVGWVRWVGFACYFMAAIIGVVLILVWGWERRKGNDGSS
jgi:hypothetical protein